MPIPTSKTQLLLAIQTDFEKLLKELQSITPDQVEVKELEGHAQNTTMSVKDLVAYLLGWGQLVLKWSHKKENGKPVDFPETGFKWNELGSLAQKFYSDYEADEFEILVLKLRETVEDIIALVESKSNADLYGVAWYEKYTHGRMIQLNTSSPYKNALARIRKWKKTKKSA